MTSTAVLGAVAVGAEPPSQSTKKSWANRAAGKQGNQVPKARITTKREVKRAARMTTDRAAANRDNPKPR